MQKQIYDFITTSLNPQANFEFDPAADLMQAGVLDSTAMIELIVWLEDTFGIQIDTEDLTPENFGTLDSMAAYVTRLSPKS